jgi:hypothetical protein
MTRNKFHNNLWQCIFQFYPYSFMLTENDLNVHQNMSWWSFISIKIPSPTEIGRHHSGRTENKKWGESTLLKARTLISLKPGQICRCFAIWNSLPILNAESLLWYWRLSPFSSRSLLCVFFLSFFCVLNGWKTWVMIYCERPLFLSPDRQGSLTLNGP